MTTGSTQQSFSQSEQHPFKRQRNSRVIFGAIIIMIGLLIFFKRLGILFFPFHVWPFVMIAIGLFIGVKSQFRSFGSWVLISLGILFSIPKFFFFGVYSHHLVAPVILILLGIYLIIRPKRMHSLDKGIGTIDEDMVDLDLNFGEKTAIVTSRNFKGGIISNSFGSTKLNLQQADSKETMILDLKVSFGSVEILVPSHWDVEFKVETNLGSVEDQRFIRTISTEEKRLLILQGNCSFGSVKVKSI
jgi:predicted membrane protein